MDDTTNQGDDCASVIHEHEEKFYACGYYGSIRDTELWQFLETPPAAWKNADPVCDVCIQKMIDEGMLVQVPGTFHFGPPWIATILAEAFDRR